MNKIYDDEFIPYILRWGRITNSVALLLSLLPVAANFFIFKLIPDAGMLAAALTSVLSVMLFLVIIEPIAYFPVLGIPGLFMAFLTGNIGNLKVPASAVAQDAAGVEVGSPQGNIISVIGIAVSTIVSVIFISLAVFLGASILSTLPKAVVSALNYLLPALFGGLLAKFSSGHPKLGAIAISICIVTFFIVKQGWLSFLPSPGGVPTYVVIMCSVFGTMFAAKKMTKL